MKGPDIVPTSLQGPLVFSPVAFPEVDVDRTVTGCPFTTAIPFGCEVPRGPTNQIYFSFVSNIVYIVFTGKWVEGSSTC